MRISLIMLLWNLWESKNDLEPENVWCCPNTKKWKWFTGRKYWHQRHNPKFMQSVSTVTVQGLSQQTMSVRIHTSNCQVSLHETASHSQTVNKHKNQSHIVHQATASGIFGITFSIIRLAIYKWPPFTLFVVVSI